MKIKQVDQLYAKDNFPSPDEMGERARKFLQQHRDANKDKPKIVGMDVSPEEHARNMWHREQDRKEYDQRQDRATAFESSTLNEISNELLSKYKTAAGKQASAADKKGDVNTANKRFKGIVKATNKQFDNDKKAVAEGRVDSPVSAAITRRIIDQRPGLLKYGPGAVMAAIDWVADSVGQVDEIGTSDVSGWVQQVERYLYTGSQGIGEGTGEVAVTELSRDTELKWIAAANKWRDEETKKGGWPSARIVNKADRHAERTMKLKNKHVSAPINELTVDTLRKYADNVKQMDPATTPKYKMVKHIEGHATANQKIAQKTGDRRHRMYESMLSDIMEAFDANAFADILSKQDQTAQKVKPKAAVVELDFHGWTIKYRKGTPSEWMVLDKKGDVKKTGSSATDKDAVSDAEEWIKSGGGAAQQASKNVTIDFNVDFAKEFAPDGETFYATIDKDNGVPVLIFSTMPDKSLKTSHIRTQVNKVTSGTTKLPMISLSPKESNAMGLQPNGRYILGDKISVDDNTSMFTLIYQGTVQGKGDMMKLGKPGLTVAHSRD